MDDPRNQLHALAQAALQQAQERHGQAVTWTDPATLSAVDQILDCERTAGDPEWIEPLTLCYGAWWGEYLHCHFGAQWTGLQEPTPPRIIVAGVVYSPLDAVRRRLIDKTSPNLQSLASKFISETIGTMGDALTANRSAWDAKANDPRFTATGRLPLTREEAVAAVDPWLCAHGPLESCRLLCLAAGGGTHGPLHAMAGASVTVVDFSPRQLERDRQVAQELKLSLELIAAPMHDLNMLGDKTFDAILHPVSLCYVRDVEPVYAEIRRLLKPNGIYISQQKQPASMQASTLRSDIGYVLEHPCDEGHPLPVSAQESGIRESGTVEFVHSLDTLLGSLCRNGFVIEEIGEHPRGDGWARPGTPEHRARYLPPYLKIKARVRNALRGGHEFGS